MPFRIEVHGTPAILEVTYPDAPTPLEIADYVNGLRTAIGTLKPGWMGLVNQGGLRLMSTELVEALTVMNAYAQGKGMARLARVVPDSFGGMQAWRIAKDAALKIPAETFSTRDEALAWLRAPLPAKAG